MCSICTVRFKMAKCANCIFLLHRRTAQRRVYLGYNESTELIMSLVLRELNFFLKNPSYTILSNFISNIFFGGGGSVGGSVSPWPLTLPQWICSIKPKYALSIQGIGFSYLHWKHKQSSCRPNCKATAFNALQTSCNRVLRSSTTIRNPSGNACCWNSLDDKALSWTMVHKTDMDSYPNTRTQHVFLCQDTSSWSKYLRAWCCGWILTWFQHLHRGDETPPAPDKHKILIGSQGTLLWLVTSPVGFDVYRMKCSFLSRTHTHTPFHCS